MENKLSNRERIALGECISDRGTEHCPVCIDRCDAFRNMCNLKDVLDRTKIEFKPFGNQSPEGE